MIAALMLMGALILQDPATEKAERMSRGHGLLEACEAWALLSSGEMGTPEQHIMFWRCAEYTKGVADTLDATSMLCLPDGVTNGQQRAVVLKYLRDHPERLHELRSKLVRDALQKAWPCKAKS